MSSLTHKREAQNVYSYETRLGTRYRVCVTRNHVLHRPPGRYETLAAALEARDLLTAALGKKYSGRPRLGDDSCKVARELLRAEIVRVMGQRADKNRAAALVYTLRRFVPGQRLTADEVMKSPVTWSREAAIISKLLLNECRVRVSEVASSLTVSGPVESEPNEHPEMRGAIPACSAIVSIPETFP